MTQGAECLHDWRITRQIRNTWREWRIMYECIKCGTKKNELRESPLCISCGGSLDDAHEGDIQAGDALQRAVDRGMSDGIAFRCCSCRKIHVLPYLE